jgi:hypothetical protein
MQRLQLCGNPVRQGDIVCVHPGDEGTPGLLQGSLQSPSDADAPGGVRDHPRIERRQRRHARRAAVCRAVVGRNELELCVSLG